MQAVVYLELHENPNYGYQKPLLEWVNNTFRPVTTLDIDNRSDKMLIDYASRLLNESDKAVLFIETGKDAPLKAAAPIIEQVIKPEKQSLILLHGQHQRLQQLFEARPKLRWFQHEEERQLRQEISKFFEEETA